MILVVGQQCRSLKRQNANAVHTIQRNRDSLVDVICLERAGKMRLICAMSAATAAAVAALRVEFESTAAIRCCKAFSARVGSGGKSKNFSHCRRKNASNSTRLLDHWTFLCSATWRKFGKLLVKRHVLFIRSAPAHAINWLMFSLPKYPKFASLNSRLQPNSLDKPE